MIGNVRAAPSVGVDVSSAGLSLSLSSSNTNKARSSLIHSIRMLGYMSKGFTKSQDKPRLRGFEREKRRDALL